MIYRYDQPVDMPIPELYDTGIMNAYLNAVKDQYESGEKRMDEYLSKYSDFTSPFQQDVENYDKLTYGRLNDAIDNMEAMGIDPLRTAEGRAMIAKVIRTTPRDKINQIIQSSKTGQAYLQAMAQLQSKGLYSQQMEDFFQKHKFKDWDTLKNGLFDRVSPIEYKNLHDLTDDWFKHLDKKFNEKLTNQKKDGYDYYTVDENDIRGVLKSNINDFLSSDYGKYYYSQAKDKVRAVNPLASEADIDKLAMKYLTDDIVNRNSDYLREEKKVNEYALENIRFQHDMDKQKQQQQYEDQKEANKQKQQAINLNYHQTQLLRGLGALMGLNIDEYKANGLLLPFAEATSEAKKVLEKKVSKIPYTGKTIKGGKEEVISSNQSKKYSAKVQGATITHGEPFEVTYKRFGHQRKAGDAGKYKLNVVAKVGKSSDKDVIKTSIVDGFTISKQEASRLIDGDRWAAETSGSHHIMQRPIPLHRDISRKLNEHGKSDRVLGANRHLVFVPRTGNNVATTVKRNGQVVQATVGTLYVRDENNRAVNVGTVYMPFNYTSIAAKDGKADRNTYVTSGAYAPNIDYQEANLRDSYHIKTTDKGSASMIY